MATVGTGDRWDAEQWLSVPGAMSAKSGRASERGDWLEPGWRGGRREGSPRPPPSRALPAQGAKRALTPAAALGAGPWSPAPRLGT